MSVKRFIKGIKSVNKVMEGRYYLENPDNEVEAIARDRAEVCFGCENFKDEPIEWLKIKDKNIPKLSGKYCGECLCVLSYKTRTKEKCDRWQE